MMIKRLASQASVFISNLTLVGLLAIPGCGDGAVSDGSSSGGRSPLGSDTRPLGSGSK